ncbi:FMN-binding protein [Anaeromicropila herbilytica]|uniref:4Fe-4S ferredoxin-type domain-containing protein n=1 Tax=Anaeromicropila herbilytica TaxID=2785025 RepID=A0A7R7EJT2_9FIRM|nr:FMN-binding protein [Anaeromicropila herbilytica]BCN29911.1 hypothetical protein bsdtb5_12060 [Anaeromicropila herbilytica]
MKKAKKLSIVAISRAFIQVLCFVFLPSLYISALMGVKELYLAAIHNEFSANIITDLIPLIATVPLTILLGRFFCGWMCAFGSFTDFIYKVSSQFVTKKKLKEEIDGALKYVKYGILVLIIMVIWSLNVTVFSSSSPWDVFGMLFTVGKLPDLSYVISYLTVGFVLFIAIIIASVFVERFFCRYLCPMGAIFGLTSLLRIGKIRKPTDGCGKCRICTNNCAMGIPLYKYDEVSSPECINCMKCVSSCPRNNTSYSVAKKDVRPLMAGCVSFAVMTGIYYVGNITASANGGNTTISSTSTNNANSLYNDGTYEGSGTGFRGQTTTVNVTVKSGAITNIETVTTGDDGDFYNRAFNGVTSDIISSQSTDVDSVSGATYSSNGIMEAVANALESAKTGSNSSQSTDSNATSNDSSSSTSSNTEDSSNGYGRVGHKGQRSDDSKEFNNSQDADVSNNDANSSSKSSSSSTAEYTDGTYEGSGTGFRGATTTLKVTVSKGKISDISVESYGDDAQFFESAYDTVTQEIISEQSTNVDSVSGATYSSNGIMEAVADALNSATK